MQLQHAISSWRNLGVSRTDILQLICVLAGAKPACRLMIGRRDVAEFRDSVTSLKVRILVGHERVVADPEETSVNFCEWGSLTRVTADQFGDCYVYVANSLKHLENVRFADETSDDYTLGLLLGYPICCVRDFVSNISEGKSKDKWWRSFEHGRCAPWPINISFFEFDWSILPYFPCGPDCSESLNLAKKYYSHFSEYFVEEAKVLKSTLLLNAIQIRGLGTMAVETAADGEETIIKNCSHITPGSELEKFFPVGQRFLVHPNGLQVGSVLLYSDSIAISYFE